MGELGTDDHKSSLSPASLVFTHPVARGTAVQADRCNDGNMTVYTAQRIKPAAC
jgi:hypothetical protein